MRDWSPFVREWLFAIGCIYLLLAWFALVYGGISIASHQGAWALWRAFHPLNYESWAFTAAVLAPGVAMVVLGKEPGSRIPTLRVMVGGIFWLVGWVLLLGGVALTIADLAYVARAAGIGVMLDVVSPFNPSWWEIVALTLAPGIGLILLGRWVRGPLLTDAKTALL